MVNHVIKVILITFFLASCSSQTTVHLFAANLNSTSVTQIETRLVNQGFEVQVNRQPFPESINSNAIVYTPGKYANERVTSMMTAMADLGYIIASTNLIMQNNHSFSANNIGLYLLPEGYVFKKTEYQIPLVNEYGSRDCYHASNLILKKDQKFVLTVNRWDSGKQDYSEQFYRGYWHVNKDYLIELIHTAWLDNLLFLRNENEINSNDGLRRVVSLIPQSSPKSAQVKALNCSYSISLII